MDKTHCCLIREIPGASATPSSGCAGTPDCASVSAMRLTELVTPLKPLEAMARGRLLVASDVGGHRELIRHGRTGTLFKAGDPEALVSAVLALLREPARWPGLKAAARLFVETERNWKSSVARYEDIYARILQQPAHA